MSSTNSDSREQESKRLQKEYGQRSLELDSSGAGNSGSNEYSDRPPLPFLDQNQQVFLIGLANRNQHPRCQIPAFNILGGFKDVTAIKRHVQRSGMDSFGGIALHAAEAHKKTLVAVGIKKQQDSSYTMKTIEEISNLYAGMLDFHNKEFQENLENKKQGSTGLSQKERLQKSTKKSSRKILLDKKFKEFQESANENYGVGRNAELRDQNYAVVSVIDDMRPAAIKGLIDPEPVFIIWGCFDKEDDAKHYIYNTAQSKVSSVMMDVYKMYEWIYPTEMNADGVQEEYRDPRLDKVMKSRKKTKASVMKFEEFVSSQGKEVPTLEIDATGEETKVKTIGLGTEMTVSTRDTISESKDENDDATKHLSEFSEVKGQLISDKFKSTEFVADNTDTAKERAAKKNEDEESEAEKPVSSLEETFKE
jgi:hypothetical protein